ncbi:Alpha/Beta hydrolase protein [Exophiala viscosa]|uniref:Alpha/Beta hydrolase protein n=1 Tax=Exophiala viscosa TaxID=2486360 RepID=UPI00218EC3E9|nr:Alpha/Beta hydrolase protein [Exophiala viscosa]
MSEPDIATKAPESDAFEPSAISDQDSRAQTGASMGEHCVTDRPNPEGRQPSGEMSKFGDVDIYISKPADYPNAPAKLLLLLTAGTGVHSINNQVQADIFAEQGFVVIMPDQFNGDPAPNSKPVPTQEENPGILEQFKLKAAETAKSFMVDMWLARQTPEKVIPILLKVIETAKDEYADAVAHGDGIYCAGYCFGGKYTVLLAGEYPAFEGQAAKDEEAGPVKKGPLIKAGALAHATLVTREDLKAVKAPLTFACVEHDPLFPAEILEEGKKLFASSNIEHEIKIYSDVPHGFAVYGDYDSASIREAQEEAFQQMLKWLQSH